MGYPVFVFFRHSPHRHHHHRLIRSVGERILSPNNMANPQLAASGFANGQMGGIDSNGSPRPLSALAASIDRYDIAYVAADPGHTPTGYYVVARATLPVGTTTINVTWTGKSQDGTVLPPLVESYDLVGPTPPPQDVAIVKLGEGYGSGAPPVPDPGSASITLI